MNTTQTATILRQIETERAALRPLHETATLDGDHEAMSEIAEMDRALIAQMATIRRNARRAARLAATETWYGIGKKDGAAGTPRDEDAIPRSYYGQYMDGYSAGAVR